MDRMFCAGWFILASYNGVMAAWWIVEGSAWRVALLSVLTVLCAAAALTYLDLIESSE